MGAKRRSDAEPGRSRARGAASPSSRATQTFAGRHSSSKTSRSKPFFSRASTASAFFSFARRATTPSSFGERAYPSTSAGSATRRRASPPSLRIDQSAAVESPFRFVTKKSSEPSREKETLETFTSPVTYGRGAFPRSAT